MHNFGVSFIAVAACFFGREKRCVLYVDPIKKLYWNRCEFLSMRVAALSFFHHFVLLEEVVVVCVCVCVCGGGYRRYSYIEQTSNDIASKIGRLMEQTLYFSGARYCSCDSFVLYSQ